MFNPETGNATVQRAAKKGLTIMKDDNRRSRASFCSAVFGFGIISENI